MEKDAMNLKTIAKMAGVSTVTVSNVMNGKYNKASKETIERVQKIIAETNYHPQLDYEAQPHYRCGDS